MRGHPRPGAALVAGLALVLAGAPAAASTVAALSIDEILAASELVFEGRVIAAESADDPDGRGIHTVVRFAVLEVVKGVATGPEVTLRYLGGRSGERRLAVAGSVLPSPGEHGLWFVESTTRPLVHPLVGWEQGCLLIEPDARGRGRLHTRSGGAVVAVDLGEPLDPPALGGDAARNLVVRRGVPREQALPAEAFKGWLRARLAEAP